MIGAELLMAATVGITVGTIGGYLVNHVLDTKYIKDLENLLDERFELEEKARKLINRQSKLIDKQNNQISKNINEITNLKIKNHILEEKLKIYEGPEDFFDVPGTVQPLSDIQFGDDDSSEAF